MIVDGVLKKYWGIGIAEEIPDGVTVISIGEEAFMNCDSLISITINEFSC